MTDPKTYLTPLEGESPEAFEAFQVFALIPRKERGVVAAAKKLGKSHQLLSRWANEWNWPMRVAAFDSAVAAARAEVLLSIERASAGDWAKRKQEFRDELWHKQIQLRDLINRAIERFDPDEASASEVVKMIELWITISKDALGIPKDRVEHTGADGGPILVAFQEQLNRAYGKKGQTVIDVTPTAGRGGCGGGDGGEMGEAQREMGEAGAKMGEKLGEEMAENGRGVEGSRRLGWVGSAGDELDAKMAAKLDEMGAGNGGNGPGVEGSRREGGGDGRD